MGAGANSQKYREWRKIQFIEWANAGFPKRVWCKNL